MSQHVEFFHSFILIKCPFIATCQESCGKVMFSVTSVCSQGRGSHVTINHATFDFTVQPIPYTWYFTGQETPPPPPLPYALPPSPRIMGPRYPPHSYYWHLLAIAGDLFKLVCFRTPSSSDICWLSKHVQSAQASSMHPAGMLSCVIKNK